MSLIVQKFGGSSVANAERVMNVARIVTDTYKEGNDVVVVVSAQGDTTDDLIEKAKEINPKASKREMDMLLTAGEQISISLLAMAIEKLGCPVFVKPANTGSSVGVAKASGKEELGNAIKEAFKYDKKIVVEECIIGREVECAVLGSINPTVSVVGEIKPANEFYDYDAKYKNDSSVLLIPAPLDEKTSGEIRSLAVKIFKSLNCTGLSRVDFFVQSDGKVKFNEINTLPGFTPISMYPKLFDECGIKYPDLIDRLLNSAIEREA